MKSQINVFARFKPSQNKNCGVCYQISENNTELNFSMGRNPKSGYIQITNNNFKELLNFRFAKIFDQDVTQEKIFEDVAKPVVLNCLEGYNGTIFCYGQTGSGKTFTMSGAGFMQKHDNYVVLFQE